MSNQTNKLAMAFQAFKDQEYAASQALLMDCEPGAAAHLRGLVERRLGNLDVAQQQLELAAKMEPENHEIYHNQALVCLDQGYPDRSMMALDRALTLKPDFVAAQKTYGRALRESKRWAEARTYYLKLLETLPEDHTATFGLATAELELGEIESALARFTGLLAGGMNESGLYFMHGRAALQSGDDETALTSLLTAHTSGPNALTLRELGRLYWMRGQRDAFISLVQAPYANSHMATMALELLRLSGAEMKELAEASRRAVDTSTPEREAIMAQAYIDAADPERAIYHANRCLQESPDQAGGMAALISAYLMSGQPQKALEQARVMQAKEPAGQQWIAYEATALRAIDPHAYRELVDIERHVRAFSLPVPEGYASLEVFNQDLLSALDRLHMFKAQPLDQSLRLGTQTARDLTSVSDPAIQAYIAALDQPIRRYMAAIGNSADHPLTRRNTYDYRLSGCWSVRLSGGGHHVNHMHPEGWISSAYYVQVPETDSTSRSGWIKFSEPPFATTPALEPERWIQPVAGMLVLFPSYLWHGTAPIIDNAIRVTAPFDVVPV